MKTLSFSDFALGLAVASLAACGGSSPPVSAAAAQPQTRGLSAPTSGRNGALLYVSEPASNRVSIYEYPSLKYKEDLPGLRDASGLCSDPRTGNVWVISFSAGHYKFSDFARGATQPIQTFQSSAFDLYACSVNPTNGDLAVTQFTDADDAGGLFVFSSGTTKSTYYQARNLFTYFFVGYDPNGNAFVDGYNSAGAFHLDELPSGSKKFIDVTPAGFSVSAAGGVQYDGTYITVGDQHHGLIYRISKEKVVGTTKLLQTCLVRQFAIDGNSVIAPTYCHHKGDVLVYRYPAGGSPTHQVNGLRSAFAAAISQ